MPDPYRSEAVWLDRRPGALVVACSDGRFDEALDEFCSKRLGLAGYDRLFVQGGIQILRLGSLLPKFEWAGRRLLRFLVDQHDLKRLVCVSHHGCAWYRELKWGPEAHLDSEIRQKRDLAAVAGDLRELWSGLKVEAYFARPEGGRAVFEDVAGP